MTMKVFDMTVKLQSMLKEVISFRVGNYQRFFRISWYHVISQNVIYYIEFPEDFSLEMTFNTPQSTLEHVSTGHLPQQIKIVNDLLISSHSSCARRNTIQLISKLRFSLKIQWFLYALPF